MLSPCFIGVIGFIGVNDFPRCFAFHGESMTVLGHQLRFSESDRPRAGWQQPGVARPLFGIASAENGKTAAPMPVPRACPHRTTLTFMAPICGTPMTPRSGWPAMPRALSAQNASGRASRAI
jgi:hypothetical protein